MKIKKKTHYTMKVLIHLALFEANNDSSSYIDIKNISDDLEISYEHVRKIIKSLVKLEIVETLRGRNGGIKLALPNEKIHIYDLILEIEEVTIDDFKHDCKNCNMPIDCGFRNMLKEQYKTFYNSFKGVYLSNFIPPVSHMHSKKYNPEH